MATLQDLINQERRGAVVVTRPLSGNGSVRDSGAVGLGEKGALSDSFNDLSEAQRIYQGVYNSTGQTFRPETWRTPGSTGSAYGGFGGSAGSGTGSAKASDALARDKFNYDKQQDALKLGGMQKYYDSGSANKGFDALLKMIGDQGTVSEGAVKKAYDTAITNVDQGYGAAQNLGDSGYEALNKYLTANQNDPYAGMQATVGSAPDALTQYLNAYGVSDQPVQGQIQADQLQAQQGAGNYQNLINLLSSVAQSGASSRGAESAMGQNLFNTTLGQERAGYKTRAEMAQADAMRQIQQIMYEQRMAQESARNSQMQQLAQALAAAGGNAGGGDSAAATTNTPFVPSQTVVPPTSEDGRTAQQIQYGNLIRNAPGQNTDELLRELNARRGY
tara:strand:+ start:396 stop:1562 length:1167 start_codon:yes stop_codon:yes gene_type:complete